MRKLLLLFLFLCVYGKSQAQDNWVNNWFAYIQSTVISGPPGGGTKQFIGSLFDSLALYCYNDTTSGSKLYRFVIAHSGDKIDSNKWATRNWVATNYVEIADSNLLFLSPYQAGLNYYLKSDADALFLRKLDTLNMLETRSHAAATYRLASQTTTLSGDVSGSGTNSITVTLPNVNSNTGRYGSSNAIPRVTVNSKGQVTAIDTIPLTPLDSVGGTISSLPAVGDIVPRTTAAAWIQAEYYKSKPPTAALTGGVQMEKHSAGTFTGTLNWSAGRQDATQPLATVVVATVSQTFSQPSAPGTATGTQSVTVTYNTNTTFTNVVTTTDSKTASASTTWSFLTKYYAGFVSSTITDPTDADIQGLSTQFLNSSRTQNNATYTPTGSQKLVIAFDQALDGSGISTIWSGGTDQTSAFTRTVRSFTNASGYTTNYIIFVQKQPTAGALTFNIQ